MGMTGSILSLGSDSISVLLDNEEVLDMVSKAERFLDSLRKFGWRSWRLIKDVLGLYL